MAKLHLTIVDDYYDDESWTECGLGKGKREYSEWESAAPEDVTCKHCLRAINKDKENAKQQLGHPQANGMPRSA